MEICRSSGKNNFAQVFFETRCTYRTMMLHDDDNDDDNGDGDDDKTSVGRPNLRCDYV